MNTINLDDLPVLDFDAGVPDTHWGETVTASVTTIVAGIIAVMI